MIDLHLSYIVSFWDSKRNVTENKVDCFRAVEYLNAFSILSYRLVYFNAESTSANFSFFKTQF